MTFERFEKMMDLLSMEVKQHYVPRSEANCKQDAIANKTKYKNI